VVFGHARRTGSFHNREARWAVMLAAVGVLWWRFKRAG